MMVEVASTSVSGMELRSTFKPDIVMVDMEMPDSNGADLIGLLSAARNCGIIAISGMTDEADRILGLELGADDYIAKPLAMREMVARVRAVHRRVVRAEGPAPSGQGHTLVIGPISINFAMRSVKTADEERLILTGAEFSLLEALAKAGGQPVTRDILSETVLRRTWRADDRAIDQLVFCLRQKLPKDEGGVTLIHSIRGAGYLLRAPQEGDRRNRRTRRAPAYQAARIPNEVAEPGLC